MNISLKLQNKYFAWLIVIDYIIFFNIAFFYFFLQKKDLFLIYTSLIYNFAIIFIIHSVFSKSFLHAKNIHLLLPFIILLLLNCFIFLLFFIH